MQNKRIIGIASLVTLVIWAGVFYTSKNPSAPIVDLNQAKSDAALKKINILLPKSKVNVAYYTSYNAVVNDFVILENAYRDDVAPLIPQARDYIAKNDYQGLANLGIKAKSINDTQKKRVAILSADFNNLAASNATLTDPMTKSLTTNFIAAGRNVAAVYSAYSKLIDDMISGNLSAQSVTDAKTIASNSATATVAFRDATKKLTAYFGQTLGNDLRDYLLASSTSKK